jgi:hypothetical protein
VSNSDKGTIRIERETFEEHNERRKDLGLKWKEYIDGETPDAVIGEDLAAKLDAIEDAATTTEEQVQELKRDVEELKR